MLNGIKSVWYLNRLVDLSDWLWVKFDVSMPLAWTIWWTNSLGADRSKHHDTHVTLSNYPVLITSLCAKKQAFHSHDHCIWTNIYFFLNKFECFSVFTCLTHCGQVMHICVSKLTNIGSDNGLSPGRRQAIISINGGILLDRPLVTNFCEILIEIRIFSFKKMHSKMLSGKWRPFCPGLNVLSKVWWTCNATYNHIYTQMCAVWR